MRDFRLRAEWEKQSAVILAMPHRDTHWKPYLAESQQKIYEIATQIARFQDVIVIYKYAEDVESLHDKNRIHLVNLATNDTWCRDFVAICGVKKRKIIMLDFMFNAWGLKFAANLDNTLSKRLFESGILSIIPSDIKFKSKHFILEGGSIDTNGKGVLLTTTQCLLESNRNALSKKKIEKKLQKYLNVSSILWLENGYLAGDDTDCHIDNLARFIDSNTILYLKCEDRFDEHFCALEAMERELKMMKNKDGRYFNLIPIPMPQAIFYENLRLPASYINFLMINDAVLLPVFGDKNDKRVIEIFEKLLPKREIIPIDSRILLRQGGSIHCLSMNIPATK